MTRAIGLVKMLGESNESIFSAATSVRTAERRRKIYGKMVTSIAVGEITGLDIKGLKSIRRLIKDTMVETVRNGGGRQTRARNSALARSDLSARPRRLASRWLVLLRSP